MNVIEKKVDVLVNSNDENCKKIMELEVAFKDLYLRVNDQMEKVQTKLFLINLFDNNFIYWSNFLFCKLETIPGQKYQRVNS